MNPQPPALWPSVLLLGMTTIGAYGVAYYSIGVLIPAISEETGWRSSTLGAAFSLGLLLQGGAAIVLGNVLDRRGSRVAFGLSLAVGAASLLAASRASEAWQFVFAWTLGAAAIGGGLYYNVTMPALGRLFPGRRAEALSGLTLLGALASPIFYPFAAWLVESAGWRGSVQALVLTLVLCCLPAVVFLQAPGSRERPGSRETGADLIRSLREPAIQRSLVLFGTLAFANAAVMLYQVPIMQATGLSLATASAFAGVRGFCQVPGRLLLTPLVRILGVRGLLGACYLLSATSILTLLLAVSAGGATTLVVYFMVVSGISLGLLSPLNGLFQSEVYGDFRLGTLSGVTVVTASIAGAAGSWLGGIANDLFGSFVVTLAASATLQAVAILLLLWQSKAAQAPQGSVGGLQAGATTVRGEATGT